MISNPRENAPLAIQTLVDVATNGKTESSRVAASAQILGRAYGKPTQQVAVDPFEGRTVRDMSDEELRIVAAGAVVYRDRVEDESDHADLN